MTNSAGMTQPWLLDRPSQGPRRTWTPLLLTQLVVILAVLAAGVAGAALRGGAQDKDVLSVVQAASTTAAAQRTMRASYEMRIQGAGLDVRSTGEIVTDQARGLSSGRFTAPGLGELEIRSIGGVGYMRLPDGRADAKGNHWISYRAFQPGAVTGGQDPMTMLKLLGDPTKVDDAGEQDVNGVKASHYRVFIDPARLAAELAKSGLNFGIPPGTIEQMKEPVVDLWVDDANLPRRMTMSVRIQQVKATFRFDFFDFGKPVEVTAPDSGDVTAVASPLELGKVLRGVATG